MAYERHLVVVDDSPWNIESAKLTLASYRLTTFSELSEAFDFLSSDLPQAQHVDAVLTDLMMPAGKLGERAGKIDASEIIPGGTALALIAVTKGLPVLILSDLNHHHGGMPWLLEEGLGFQTPEEEQSVGFERADCAWLPHKRWDGENASLIDVPMVDPMEGGHWIKDWAKAMSMHKTLFPWLAD